VLIGKTNLDEFAFGTTSSDSAYGPVRNPHDSSRSPGGSSGGSAVSVAAAMVFAAVGTDTGGSIRVPAAACGIVGLKATYGEVSTDGVVPLSPTLDHVGPFGRSVADAWLMHRALIGATATVPLGARLPGDARLGLLRPYFCDLLDPEVRERFDETLRRLRRAGVRVDEAEIPDAANTPIVYRHIHGPEGATWHETTLANVPERYTPAVRQRLESGRHVLAGDYLRALSARDELRRQVEAALEGRDALVLPTLPIPAPPIGADTVVVDGTNQQVRATMLRNTQLFNLTGHPVISLPCGRTSEGLPCGLQLVGHRHQTEALLALALGCETVLHGVGPGGIETI
jgi:aspartyl-tRNA(Asn)/glutamyl-tRNA(Gln) amidotransferase subunit A